MHRLATPTSSQRGLEDRPPNIACSEVRVRDAHVKLRNAPSRCVAVRGLQPANRDCRSQRLGKVLPEINLPHPRDGTFYGHQHPRHVWAQGQGIKGSVEVGVPTRLAKLSILKTSSLPCSSRWTKISLV